MRRPRAPTNSAFSSGAASLRADCRASACSASRAFAPTGTVRVFEPLPVTVTSPCAGSSSRFERHQLADAQPRGIEQLEHRRVLQRQR